MRRSRHQWPVRTWRLGPLTVRRTDLTAVEQVVQATLTAHPARWQSIEKLQQWAWLSMCHAYCVGRGQPRLNVAAKLEAEGPGLYDFHDPYGAWSDRFQHYAWCSGAPLRWSCLMKARLRWQDVRTADELYKRPPWRRWRWTVRWREQTP